jgi:hypothetical protein
MFCFISEKKKKKKKLSMGCCTSASEKVSKKVFDPKLRVYEDEFFESLRTREFLQKIIDNKQKIISTSIAENVISFLKWFASANGGRTLALQSGVYDIIINCCAKHATTNESARCLGDVISIMCSDCPDGRSLFSTTATASILSSALQNHASSFLTVLKLSLAVQDICVDNPEGRKLFSTRTTAQAFTRAFGCGGKKSSEISVLVDLCIAVKQICEDNESGLQVFAAEEIGLIKIMKERSGGFFSAQVEECLDECVSMLEEFQVNRQRKEREVEMKRKRDAEDDRVFVVPSQVPFGGVNLLVENKESSVEMKPQISFGEI